ncbi:uncharacterized protein METZ01_LOCUS376540 [marine metagenome]|uniref:Uncharacterized protein n=1 Tax=marine metagenome TaxID=408172 RepID=A0A382TNM2_9ZZZZ
MTGTCPNPNCLRGVLVGLYRGIEFRQVPAIALLVKS